MLPWLAAFDVTAGSSRPPAQQAVDLAYPLRDKAIVHIRRWRRSGIWAWWSKFSHGADRKAAGDDDEVRAIPTSFWKPFPRISAVSPPAACDMLSLFFTQLGARAYPHADWCLQSDGVPDSRLPVPHAQ